MSEYDQAAQAAPFKDRTAGLIVFGGVEIMLGVLFALFVPLVVFANMTPPPADLLAELRTMLPDISFYAMAAVFFVWIGIGSILARRWARAVMLVCSWMWLIFGTIGTIGTIWLLPGMFAHMPPGQQLPPGVMLLMLIFIGCMWVFLPLAFVLFYRSKHVWATCQFKDPRVRWTDACPLQVLALVILCANGLLSMVWLPLNNFTVPCFGVVVDGAVGASVALSIVLLHIYLIWGIYHRKVAAWWTSALYVVLLSVSGMLSMARADLVELSQWMDIPADELDMFEQMGMVEMANSLWWLWIPWAVAFLGYLVYVKRYFGLSEGEGGIR